MDIGKKENKGMTLMEILIVVMLIGILGGILVKSISGNLVTGKKVAAKTFLETTFKMAVMTYRVKKGNIWPNSINDLASSNLLSNFTDPWGRTDTHSGYGLKPSGSDSTQDTAPLEIWVKYDGDGQSNPPSNKDEGIKFLLDKTGNLTDAFASSTS